MRFVCVLRNMTAARIAEAFTQVFHVHRDPAMKKKKAKFTTRSERNRQALKKAMRSTGRAPCTISHGSESMCGFPRPQRPKKSRRACFRCNGDGSYMQRGILRVCHCK